MINRNTVYWMTVCTVEIQDKTFIWLLSVHKCELSVDKAGSLLQESCENLINSVNKFLVEDCDMHDSVSELFLSSVFIFSFFITAASHDLGDRLNCSRDQSSVKNKNY